MSLVNPCVLPLLGLKYTAASINGMVWPLSSMGEADRRINVASLPSTNLIQSDRIAFLSGSHAQTNALAQSQLSLSATTSCAPHAGSKCPSSWLTPAQQEYAYLVMHPVHPGSFLTAAARAPVLGRGSHLFRGLAAQNSMA